MKFNIKYHIEDPKKVFQSCRLIENLSVWGLKNTKTKK